MKRITPFYGGFGFIPEKEQCMKSEFKDGLCKKHYENIALKKTPWGERPKYRDITEEEFLRGRPMMLKTSRQHIRYSFRNGYMCRWFEKLQKWIIDKQLVADFTLYCVKK